MGQYNKIVLKTPQGEAVIQPAEGNVYIAAEGENGELIVRLVPKSLASSEDKAKYFTKISVEDREKVKRWLAKQKGAPEWAKQFLERVREAVQVINYDYWIANIEPSVKAGKIYYAEGKNVGVGFSGNDWEKMAKEYAPERGSRRAELCELIMWYALRIANGLWALSYVVKDSSSAGNYSNTPDSAGKLEKTGARKCGGYRDGQGNSYKIVTVEEGIALVGGGYNVCGSYFTVANVFYYDLPSEILDYGSGVVVLTK